MALLASVAGAPQSYFMVSVFWKWMRWGSVGISPRTTACAFLLTFVLTPVLAEESSGPGGSPSPAGDSKPKNGATIESLERQVEELRAGQRMLMDELRQLRREIQGMSDRKEVEASPDPKPFVTLNVRGEPVRGSTNARVAVVVFSDFNCSHCAAFEREVFPKLEETYLRTGKVRLLFRELPDPNDKDSFAKSEAARCAGEQGHFWEMHDLLFRDPSSMTPESLAQWIASLGIEAEPFRACLSSHRYQEPIRRSIGLSTRMGIRGTPTFLIGSCDASGMVIRSEEIFTGVEPFGKFQAILDRLLQSQVAPTPSK